MKWIKHIWIWGLIVLSPVFLYGTGDARQKALEDSIRTMADSRVFSMAIRYHGWYNYTDPKAALDVNERALKIAIKENNAEQQAGFRHRIALCLYSLKQDAKALEYDLQSLQQSRELKLSQGITKALTSIGKCYLKQKELPQATKYLNEAYTAAVLNKETVYINNALEQLADLASAKGDKLSAIKYNQEAYQLSVQQNAATDIAYFGINLGIAYNDNGDYEKALEIWEAMRLILEKRKDQAALSKVYNNMGNAYVKLGNYEKSLSCYLKSLELKESSSTPQDVSLALVNLGSLYLTLEQYPKALEHYTSALQIKKQLKDEIGMASVYSSMGVAYRRLGQRDKALESYHQSVEIYRKSSDSMRLSQTLNNMGVLYSEKGETAQAMDYFNQSLQLKGIQSDETAMLSSYLNIIDLYLNRQVDLPRAAMYLRKVEAMPSGQLIPEMRVKLLSLQSSYYEQNKDYATAIRYYKQYSALQDSLYANRNSRHLAELDVKYELSSKEKQILLLRKNAELNRKTSLQAGQLRNSLIIIILLVVILAVILFGRYRALKRFNQVIMKNDVELQKLNQSLEHRVESEIAIRRQHEQKAFQQARLAALGELAAGIAHELNQPLHSLAFALDNILLYLKEDKAEPEYLNQKLDYLFEDISRMRNAIDHIRQFAKTKSDTVDELFYVNDSILQTVGLVQKQYAKLGIRIETDLATALPAVKGNPYKLEQVMLNLLSNSRDATLAKPPELSDSPCMSISLSSALIDNKLVIRCADHGIGMPEELREKAFQSFFSTKDPEHGTGLGLTISQGIVHDMQGEITLESIPGAGTTVSVTLPVAEGGC